MLTEEVAEGLYQARITDEYEYEYEYVQKLMYGVQHLPSLISAIAT
jgi:hypothetical protein